MSDLRLSKTEELVVRGVLEGKSNAEIAEELGVVEKTVKFHLTNVYSKLGITSRAQLIVKTLKEEREENEFAKLMRELIR